MDEPGKHRRFNVYMSKGEIEEYFSKDVEYDWPSEETYEPPFPLTPAEERLVQLNTASPHVVKELNLLCNELVQGYSDVESWMKFETQALVNVKRTRANLAIKLDQDIIHGPNRKIWPSDSDAVLYSYPDGLREILAGYPTKIKYYLLKLKWQADGSLKRHDALDDLPDGYSYRRHYVYSVDDNIIMTPEQYLSRFL